MAWPDDFPDPVAQIDDQLRQNHVLPGENLRQFDQRSAYEQQQSDLSDARAMREQAAADRQQQQQVKAEAIKAKDFFNRRQIPTTTQDDGTVQPVADETGAPLTNYNKASGVAYDSYWKPRKIVPQSDGSVALADPYEGAPAKVDKEGNKYTAPTGLPWRWDGVDNEVVDKNQERALASASTVAGQQATAEAHDVAAAEKDLKQRRKAMQAVVPGAVDAPDPDTARQSIDDYFNDAYAAPAANVRRGFFNTGELTDTSEQLRTQIDQQKAQAHAQLDDMQQRGQALSVIKAQAAQHATQARALQDQLVQRRLADAQKAGVNIPNGAPPSIQGNAPVVQSENQPEEALPISSSAQPSESQSSAQVAGTPGAPQAEGMIATAGRELTTHFFPAVGTAAGALLGGGLGAAAGIEAGPVAIATGIAGGLAGGAAGGALVDKIQRSLIGEQATEANEKQLEANRKAHPIAAQLGSMVPFLISLIGGGNAVKPLQKALGPLGHRIVEAALGGAQAGLSEGVQQQVVEGKDVNAIDNMTRNALAFGATGLFAPAKSLLMAATGKAVSDAAAMVMANTAYDAAVHGKPVNLQEVTNQMGGDIPAFALQNMILGLFHRMPLTAPKGGGEQLPPAEVSDSDQIASASESAKELPPAAKVDESTNKLQAERDQLAQAIQRTPTSQVDAALIEGEKRRLAEIDQQLTEGQQAEPQAQPVAEQPPSPAPAGATTEPPVEPLPEKVQPPTPPQSEGVAPGSPEATSETPIAEPAPVSTEGIAGEVGSKGLETSPSVESPQVQPASATAPEAKVSSTEAEPVAAAEQGKKSTTPRWVNESIEELASPLEKSGLADKIEELAAQRLTAGEIANRLGIQKDSVIAVRAKRQIPSMDMASEFEQWLKHREARVSSVTPPAKVEAQKAPEPIAAKKGNPAEATPVAGQQAGDAKLSTEPKGRQIVEPIENVTKGANVFHGAGSFKKVEAGVMGNAGFVPLKGEVTATDGNATEPSKPVQSPEAKKVEQFSRAAFKQHANELAALSHGDLITGETPNKSGIYTTGEGQIIIDPEKMAKDTDGLTPKQKLKKIQRTMAEEVFHVGTIRYAQESKENFAKVEALSNDAEWAKRGAEVYGKEWENLNEFQKGAEIARIIAQGKGGKLTEAAYKYLVDFLKWLRVKVKDLSPETKEVIREIEARMGKFKEESASSKNETDDSNAVKSPEERVPFDWFKPHAKEYLKRLREFDSIGDRQNAFMGAREPDHAYAGRMTGVTGDGHSRIVTALGVHHGEVLKAIKEGKPVSDDAVEQYGIKLPDGYVRDGDVYRAENKGLAASSTPEDARKSVLDAYKKLKERDGFPAVKISDLQKESGVPMDALRDWLKKERDQGSVVLSTGDWSIAGAEERAAVVKMHGQDYLQARFIGEPKTPLVAEAKKPSGGLPVRTVTPDELPDAKQAAQIKWYHGSGSNITTDSVSSSFSNIESLLGSGVYLTDGPEVSRSYAQKKGGRTPRVYEFRVKPRNVLNFDKPIPSDAIEAIRNALYDDLKPALDGILKDNPKATGSEIWRELTEEVKMHAEDNNWPKSEYAEMYQGIESLLRDAGYDAITHVGGLRTGDGARQHKVLILLDPANEYAPVGSKNPKTVESVNEVKDAKEVTTPSVKPAYDKLSKESGFPAVPISELQKASGADMDALKAFLRKERDAGRVVLSTGDWSIASPEERLGAIDMHGQKYLQVRWLPERGLGAASSEEIRSGLDKLSEPYSDNLKVEAHLSKSAEGPIIKLDHFQAKKDAPAGTGTSYMRDLVKFADENGLTIALETAAKGDLKKSDMKVTTSTNRLKDFYSRFGFKSNSSTRSYRADLPGNMHRDPKPSGLGAASLEREGDMSLGSASTPGEMLRKIHEKAVDTIQGVKDEATLGKTKDTISAKTDAATNLANYYGQQAGNSIKLDLPEKADREAMPFVIEAAGGVGGTLKQLKIYKAQIAASKDKKLAAKYAPIIDRAISELPRLEAARANHDKLMADSLDEMKAAGVDVNEVQNYVTRILDAPDSVKELLPNPLFGGGGGTGGSPRYFTKGRVFKTLAEAIQAGYPPKSTDLADLDAHRIEAGKRLVLQKKMFDEFRNTPAPTDGKPIIGKFEQVKKLNGETEQQTPRGYSDVTFGGQRLPIHDDLAGIFRDLAGSSAIRNNAAGRAFLKAAAVVKHGTLAADTFHAGRELYKMAISGGGAPITERNGRLAWNIHKGRALLEYSNADLGRAISLGNITKGEADYARTNRPKIEKLMEHGMNVGNVADNLMQQAKLHIPIISTLNDWIFGKLARSAMLQSSLSNLDRNLKNPNYTEAQAYRQTAKEMNEQFGNMQNQGLFKNKTLQDISRLIFLAPNWMESQFRNELRSYGQAGKTVVNAVRGNGFRVGNATRAFAAGMVGMLAANQIINFLSRGQTTFQNEEEGHKLDAWVPGGKRGFFFNPLEIAGEYAHAATKYLAQHENPVDVASHIASNKMSPISRGVKEAVTGRDYAGRHFLSDADRARGAITDVLPVPMFTGPLMEKDPRSPTGFRSTRAPGALQKQLMQSVGMKVTAAQSPRSAMFALAQPFRPDRGGADTAGEYTALRQALDNDDMDSARKEIQWLSGRGKDMESISRALGIHKDGSIAPELFAGGADREKEMLASLNTKERALYVQAQRDHLAIAAKFLRVSAGMRIPTKKSPVAPFSFGRQ